MCSIFSFSYLPSVHLNWVIFLLLSFKDSLYILGNSLLPDISFASISIVCGLSFYSLDIIFHRAENFNFNKVQLISSFIDAAFGVIYKKSPPDPRSFRFSPMLSLRNFIVLYFIFRSVIHFELIL